MWILGSFAKDFGFFYLPGFVGVLLAILNPNIADQSVLYALFTLAFIDSGHVYTTVWRTYFHKSELKSSRAYWMVPLVCLLAFGSWSYFRLPYLWTFVVYATLYHYIRQLYGFTKWTQLLNGRFCKTSDFFVYSLSLLPAIAYHFRDKVPSSYYSKGDILFYPSQTLLTATIAVYGITLGAWIVFEMRLWRQGRREISRILSIGCPTLLYTCCFIFGKTQSQVLLPLVFSHGVPYMAVLAQTLNRTQSNRFKRFLPALAIVGVTALLFGGATAWIEEEYIDFSGNFSPPVISLFEAAMVGVYLTPLFLHYIFDGLIWKRSHRESLLVYHRSSECQKSPPLRQSA